MTCRGTVWPWYDGRSAHGRAPMRTSARMSLQGKVRGHADPTAFTSDCFAVCPSGCRAGGGVDPRQAPPRGRCEVPQIVQAQEFPGEVVACHAHRSRARAADADRAGERNAVAGARVARSRWIVRELLKNLKASW